MNKAGRRLVGSVALSAVALRAFKRTLRGARADWRLARDANAPTEKIRVFPTTVS